MTKIEIYTKDTCPYCIQIKDLFNSKGIRYIEHSLTKNPALRSELDARGPSNHTVPQVFVNDKNIGDDDVIMDLHRAGKLDSILSS